MKATWSPVRWLLAGAATLALMAIGALGAWIYLKGSTRDGDTIRRAQVAPAPDLGDEAKLPDVPITLTPEAVDRAGIHAAPVREETAASILRLPARVEPNAYRQVVVTPLVSGRITSVSAELGDRVAPGRTLAQVYSPELAEAQTRYVTMRAELEAAHQELRRTERLVEIGAASAQELEQVRARHTTHSTDTEAARAMLILLGLSAEQVGRLHTASDVTATVDVPAPIAGVVTNRRANVGLNVDASTELFTVVDLSTVWVVGELYERDFARVQVGSEATVTTAAYPGLVLSGKVSYIDPQVSPETRTAKLRVEVENPDQKLRLGMYADMAVTDDAPSAALVVPKSAIQTVGSRHVVYLVDPGVEGKFIEREVELGTSAGGEVTIVSGVVAGDVVVHVGAFHLRAERERLGLRGGAPGPTHPQHGGATMIDEVQRARIVVGKKGYEPATVNLQAGAPVELSFVRTSDETCGTEIVLQELGIRRDLPLNDPVLIVITPEKTGEIAFGCGMGMLTGRILVTE